MMVALWVSRIGCVDSVDWACWQRHCGLVLEGIVGRLCQGRLCQNRLDQVRLRASQKSGQVGVMARVMVGLRQFVHIPLDSRSPQALVALLVWRWLRWQLRDVPSQLLEILWHHIINQRRVIAVVVVVSRRLLLLVGGYCCQQEVVDVSRRLLLLVGVIVVSRRFCRHQ